MIAKVLINVLTSKAVKAVFIALAEHLVKQTDNKLDDQLLRQVKRAVRH
ncbi:hypothetical protein [Pseudoalteromonas rubra]|nr:hypothetical protein [Pseudoalteromonas rubra]